MRDEYPNFEIYREWGETWTVLYKDPEGQDVLIHRGPWDQGLKVLEEVRNELLGLNPVPEGASGKEELGPGQEERGLGPDSRALPHV